MEKLDKRRVNFVEGISLENRVKVLYEYLNKGTSNRRIEKMFDFLDELRLAVMEYNPLLRFQWRKQSDVPKIVIRTNFTSTL